MDISANEDELQAILEEFRADYNRHHFVRTEEFKQSWDHIDGETRRLFVEFLERSCTAEFSGFLLYKELSRKLKDRPGILLAPHNWGSFLGLYMQLVLARGIGNFLMAEQDPSTSDLFDTSAFRFKEGKMSVPDLPGCGLVLREDVFKEKYQKEAWVVK